MSNEDESESDDDYEENEVEKDNNGDIRWGKKVWFTEFARPTTRDPAMELEYMQVIIFFDYPDDVDYQDDVDVDHHELHRLFCPS